MEQLEGMKPTARLAAAEEDELYMENFALKIFAKADKLDRCGEGEGKKGRGPGKDGWPSRTTPTS